MNEVGERIRELDAALTEALRLFNEQRTGLTMQEQEELAKRLFGTMLDERRQISERLDDEIRALDREIEGRLA